MENQMDKTMEKTVENEMDTRIRVWGLGLF